MSVIIVDTSVWIDFFRGKDVPFLDSFLREGRVLLSPLVLAELITGVHHKNEEILLENFLKELDIIECNRNHWKSVGFLRRKLAQKGILTSIPDSHIAQCTLECKGFLLTYDKIFKKISPFTGLQLFEV